MSYLQTFQVFPYIPEPLKFLEVLANNLWWCWNLEAIELFRRINPRLWEESGRNPLFSLLWLNKKTGRTGNGWQLPEPYGRSSGKVYQTGYRAIGGKSSGAKQGKGSHSVFLHGVRHS